MLLYRSFKQKEIYNAKAELWAHCQNEQSIIGTKKKRINSIERSGAVADARDIISALQKLDLNDSMPRIALEATDVQGVSRLIHPRDASQESAGANDRVAHLERLCTSMCEAIAHLTKQIEQLNEQNSHHANPCEWPPLVRSAANSTRGSTQRRYQNSALVPTTEAVLDHTEPRPEEESGETSLKQTGNIPETERRTHEVSAEGPRRPKPKFRRKKKSQRGSAEAGEGASKLSGRDVFHISVTNINPSITPEDLVAHLVEQDKEAVPIKAEDASLEGWDTKRFSLTFSLKLHEKVMKSEFWPEGLYFREYFPRRNATKRQPMRNGR
jgi:hypothetical protein